MDAATSQQDTRASNRPNGSEGSKNRMDQIITALVDGVLVPVTNVIPFLVTSGIALVLFALLWAGFAAGLVWNQGGLDAAWEWVRGLPLLVQGVVWLLFLPVVGALWVWESSWPLVIRLVLVVGLAGWSLMIFVPRSAQA